jgi:hypothetical protein
MMMMGGDGIFTNLLLLLTPPTFEMASGKRWRIVTEIFFKKSVKNAQKKRDEVHQRAKWCGEKTGSTGPTPFSLLVDAVGGFGFFFFLYPSKKSWMLLLLLWSTFVKVLSIRQRNQHLIYENVWCFKENFTFGGGTSSSTMIGISRIWR